MIVQVQSNYYSERINYRGWQAVLGIYLLLLVGSIFMLGELLFFHVVLVYRNMTTYDYIMAQNAGNLNSASSSASGGSGARAALCRPTRVADESTAAPKRPKVSLNPCKALTTEKLEGDPRSWSLRLASKPAATSVRADPQLQSPSPTGYYPVVSEQRQAIGYSGPHQPLGESTFHPIQRPSYPFPPSSHATMLKASTGPVTSWPTNSAAVHYPPALISGSPGLLPPPMHSPAGGSGRHIGSRAAPSLGHGFSSAAVRDPGSPTISSAPPPIGGAPSASRYSFDGRQTAASGAFDSRISSEGSGRGGFTSLWAPQGGLRT